MLIKLEKNSYYGEFRYVGDTIIVGEYSQKNLPFRCRCGNVKDIIVASITAGRSKTCGKCTSVVLKKGTRFGYLTYIGENRKIQKESQKKLSFRCDCGTVKDICIFTVMRGRAKKCGHCNRVSLKTGDIVGRFVYTGENTDAYPASHVKLPFVCNAGHESLRTFKSAQSNSCTECKLIVLNPGDLYGSFSYSEKSEVSIRPWSKKKLLFRCRCGQKKKIAIFSITNGDTVSCTNCYAAVYDWYRRNEQALRSLQCPISPDQLPKGGIAALEVIPNKTTTFKALCSVCGNQYGPRFNDIRRGQCVTCGCTGNRISGPSRDIVSFIQGLGLDPELEFELEGRYFDIFVPKANLAIELNGLRWHSKSESRARDLEKYRLALIHGIRLVSIFEDEWKHKRLIMKAIIRNLLHCSSFQGLRPSVCTIGHIKSRDANEFYNRFHYIGGCPSKVHFGVSYKGELIGCMSFRKPSRQSSYDYELSRMAMNPGWRVHGVWSHILSMFLREYSPTSVVTFSDNRLFSGDAYGKMGFRFDGNVSPDYYWVKGNRRFHKSTLRKPPGETRTESSLRTSQGYKKIWDLGKKRWVLDTDRSAKLAPRPSSEIGLWNQHTCRPRKVPRVP